MSHEYFPFVHCLSVVVHGFPFYCLLPPEPTFRLRLVFQLSWMNRIKDFQQEQAESQLPVDSLFRKIETFEPGVYAQYEEDDIHYLINNLRNTYERNSWDKRYKLFMHIADFYAMWLSDRKQLWSIGQNISLFKANLEECEIGLQKKEEDLRSGTKNK